MHSFTLFQPEFQEGKKYDFVFFFGEMFPRNGLNSDAGHYYYYYEAILYYMDSVECSSDFQTAIEKRSAVVWRRSRGGGG